MKGYTFFLDVAELRERKDLKAAAIGENRAVPAGEFMQTAELFYFIISGTQVKVICVAELYLTFYVFQVKSRNSALDRAACGDVHKSRSLNRPVRSDKFTSSGCSFGFY